MRLLTESEKIAATADSLRAAFSVLRTAHLPSLAVVEVSRRLREQAMSLELLADDIEQAQRTAAARERSHG